MQTLFFISNKNINFLIHTRTFNKKMNKIRHRSRFIYRVSYSDKKWNFLYHVKKRLKLSRMWQSKKKRDYMYQKRSVKLIWCSASFCSKCEYKMKKRRKKKVILSDFSPRLKWERILFIHQYQHRISVLLSEKKNQFFFSFFLFTSERKS